MFYISTPLKRQKTRDGLEMIYRENIVLEMV